MGVRMIELTKIDFHSKIAAHPMILIFFYNSRSAEDLSSTSVRRELETGSMPWTWAALDVDLAPEIAEMFGATTGLPALLIMREQVALHCEPLTAKTLDRTEKIIDGAARLDMSRVRRNIEQEKAGRAALFARRVCPTARRTPYPATRDQ